MKQCEKELVKIARQQRPREFQRQYEELMRKRQAETLTDAEYQELLRMTDEAEAFDARRSEALAELAELRNTDIDRLMRELGLQKSA